ncbi:hypothetical protein Sste5346_006302 [Sporothrix stenoceras]|uniref:Uncharacterized protein n=1 Tax=Sporothrix stenoceras TaxID=5173 RepID=A0ABR3YZI6_9PEZI
MTSNEPADEAKHGDALNHIEAIQNNDRRITGDENDTSLDDSKGSEQEESDTPIDTSHTRTRRLRANDALPNKQPPLTSLTPTKTRPNQAPLLDLQPLPSIAPMINPLPLPPGTAPPRAKLAVQLKMNLEIEVMLKARVCGDVVLTLL